MVINSTYSNSILSKKNSNITFERSISKTPINKVANKARDSFIRFEEKHGPITIGKACDTTFQLFPLASFLYLPEQGFLNTLTNAALLKLTADTVVIVGIKTGNVISKGLKKIHKSLYTEEMAADRLTTKNLPFNTYVRVGSFIKKRMNKSTPETNILNKAG